jgi:hypothetical protein
MRPPPVGLQTTSSVYGISWMQTLGLRSPGGTPQGISTKQILTGELAQWASPAGKISYWSGPTCDSATVWFSRDTGCAGPAAARCQPCCSQAFAPAAGRFTCADMHCAGHHVLDFWSAICICHNLIVEGDAESGAFRYQGPSPDEVLFATHQQRCQPPPCLLSPIAEPLLTSRSAVLRTLCVMRSCASLARPQPGLQCTGTASGDPRLTQMPGPSTIRNAGVYPTVSTAACVRPGEPPGLAAEHLK